jgi:epoxide hydrolase 4
MDPSHEQAIINGVRLHYVEAGEGPLVVLLHGFPEHWYAWREQIPALVAAGYRVVVPDMRGYNRSEKPHGTESYRMDEFVGDVVSLIEVCGEGRASVVGHDWGGVTAWEVAARHPEAVDRLVVLNAPHPAVYRRELRSRRSDQRKRSSYALFFQLPRLPEALFRVRGYRAIERLFREGPEDPDAFDAEEIARYKRACARPGAMTSMLNYYRAAFRGQIRSILPGERSPDRAREERIDRPTLLIWGMRDRALSPRLTEGLERWVPDLRVERLPEASHWVQADEPDRVHELLVDFLDARNGD